MGFVLQGALHIHCRVYDKDAVADNMVKHLYCKMMKGGYKLTYQAALFGQLIRLARGYQAQRVVLSTSFPAYWFIYVHSCQIWSPLETGFIVSAHRLT